MECQSLFGDDLHGDNLHGNLETICMEWQSLFFRENRGLSPIFHLHNLTRKC